MYWSKCVMFSKYAMASSPKALPVDPGATFFVLYCGLRVKRLILLQSYGLAGFAIILKKKNTESPTFDEHLHIKYNTCTIQCNALDYEQQYNTLQFNTI